MLFNLQGQCSDLIIKISSLQLYLKEKITHKRYSCEFSLVTFTVTLIRKNSVQTVEISGKIAVTDEAERDWKDRRTKALLHRPLS